MVVSDVNKMLWWRHNTYTMHSGSAAMPAAKPGDFWLA
jgi:hypothetical protein